MADPCTIKAGERVDINDPRAANCTFEPGAKFYFSVDAENTNGGTMPKSPATPPTAAESESPQAVPGLPQLPAGIPGLPGMAATAQNTTATVGVNPDTTTADLTKLAAQGGAVSPMTVVLGAIAVLGGGAAWKFYSQHSKQKFELESQKIENDRRKDDDQAKECKANGVACATNTKELHARIDDLLRKMNQMTESMESVAKKLKDVEESSGKSAKFGSGLSDLEERVDEFEKKLKKVIRSQDSKS